MNVTSIARFDEDLDARGLNCPLPILRTRKAIKPLETGALLRVLSTDPGSQSDIESFCKATGNELVSSQENSGEFEFIIRKN